VSFLFVGDIMQHDGQIEAAYNPITKGYDYDDGFKYIKPIINEYDFRIANLEVTHPGKPYKGYPQFAAPDELSETAVHAGFNVILTANNHSCDGRAKGVIRTLDVLDKLGVKHTGTFRNQAERDQTYPLMVEKNGMKIALLNYTYGTNGLKVAKPLIINYIDSVVIKKDIARAIELKADYIICNMHWGSEYKPLPNKYQKTYEQVCYRAGADMVIGGHPHVVQPIEKKKVNGVDKLTVWSLGNFVSNMSVRHTRGGVMVGATVKKVAEKITLEDVEHHLVYVLKKQEGAIKQYYILPDYDYNMDRPGFISAAENVKMKEFFADSRKLYAEHNKGGILEARVKSDSFIGQRFKQYLTWHYSVQIPQDGAMLIQSDVLGHYFHKTVDLKGTPYYMSGYYQDQQSANGHLNFLRDCGVVNPSVVKVTPKGITPAE
jgi:poly-gamma-glutamate capsule biosynthesis protein CapA/YwtB (metallophosphatase superfamily)